MFSSRIIVPDYMYSVSKDKLRGSQFILSSCNKSPIIHKLIPSKMIPGSSLIRMLRDFMGEERFGRGVNSYLNKHKFSNADSEDFWSSLSEATTVPVAKMMNTWIVNPGFPVVTVRRGEGGQTAHIHQERFLTDVGAVNQSLWGIPLTWYSQVNGTCFCADMKKNKTEKHPQMLLLREGRFLL